LNTDRIDANKLARVFVLGGVFYRSSNLTLVVGKVMEDQVLG